MKKLTSILFSCAALLLIFLSSCAPQVEDLDNVAGPQADEGASTYTFHALIPGTLDNVSQMELTVFPDGTAEANRSVIPFDPDLNYSTYKLVGSSEIVEVGSDYQADFIGKTLFIPFDGQIEPSVVFETEGSLILNCWCPGGGGCDAVVSRGGGNVITDFECFSRACNRCNFNYTHRTNAPVSIPGILITASSVSTN